MSDNESDGKRSDDNDLPTSYTCQSELCKLSGFPGSGPAEKMFNLPVNPARSTVEELAQRIRCAKCAEEIAQEKGKKLYEPGCGTYPLHFTLGQIKMAKLLPSGPTFREVKVREQVEEQDYASWALGSQRQRQSAQRQERAAAYAREYMTLDFNKGGIARMPQTVEVGDRHYCGIPREVGCCGGDETVVRFLVVCGVKVGICTEASRAFLDVAHANPQDDRSRRLLWTESESTTEAVAATWSGKDQEE